jgi:ABC-type transporter Mla subunit MlaD
MCPASAGHLRGINMSEKITEFETMVNHLAKPVVEVERKMNEVRDSLTGEVAAIKDDVDAAIAQVNELVETVQSLLNLPNKFEGRVSKVEGESKHVPMIQSHIKKICADIDDIFAQLPNIGSAHEKVSSLVERHDKLQRDYSESIASVIAESSVNHDAVDQVRTHLKESDKELRDMIRNTETSSLERYTMNRENVDEIFTLIPTLEHKIAEVNNKIDQTKDELHKRIDYAYSDAMSKYTDFVKDIRAEMDVFIEQMANWKADTEKYISKLQFSLEKREFNVEKFEREQEILEMKYEKLLQRVKMMEAEV